MELVDGPSVAQLMSDGPVGAAWAMHIIAGAAAGLEAAHQAGVVHRDVQARQPSC
jgi:serine/threonine protein kinase